MPNCLLYLPVDDIHNHTIDDVASMIDGGLPLHYLQHRGCLNSKRHLKMVWHSLPHLLFVKQMGEADLKNCNTNRNLFLERRKKIRVSLHKLKPRVLCSQGILVLRGAILASGDHFRTAVPIDAHAKWMLYNGMKSEVIIHANNPTLDGAFQVNTYPVIQLFFELVPNNSEFLSLPESSSRRIQNHQLQTECIQEARARVWNQHKADTYIKRYGTNTEDEDNDDTSSAGGYMSDADPYRYNFLQA